MVASHAEGVTEQSENGRAASSCDDSAAGTADVQPATSSAAQRLLTRRDLLPVTEVQLTPAKNPSNRERRLCGCSLRSALFVALLKSIRDLFGRLLPQRSSRCL